jgi:two-component system chemotaxis response regulator CheY
MGIKLVIVDDAPFIREALRNIIEGAGFEVVGEASDGQSALELARYKFPDVIIMDLVMPNENGIEATKKILDECPGIKIIACSTQSEKSMALKAIEAGCCGFIAKPFQVDEVISKIKSAIKQ